MSDQQTHQSSSSSSSSSHDNNNKHELTSAELYDALVLKSTKSDTAKPHFDLTILGIGEVEDELEKGTKWDVVVSILCPPGDTRETMKHAILRHKLTNATTNK